MRARSPTAAASESARPSGRDRSVTVNPPSGCVASSGVLGRREGGQVRAEAVQGGAGELADLGVAAEGGADGVDLGGDVGLADGAELGEPGPGPGLPLGHRLPGRLELLGGLLDLGEREQLVLTGGGPLPSQQPLDDRVGDLAGGLVGDRDGDAGGLADLAVLADQDLKDLAVDAVVPAVDRDDADIRGPLPEPVDAALPLLVPGRVPGEVVVDDRVERGLQVHALGQAVGRDQDQAGPLIRADGVLQSLDAVGALRRGEGPVDAVDEGLGAQGRLEMLGDVLAGGNVAAEHDGAVPVLHQRLDDLRRLGELQVLLRPLQGLRPGGEVQQRGVDGGGGSGGYRGQKAWCPWTGRRPPPHPRPSRPPRGRPSPRPQGSRPRRRGCRRPCRR